VNEIASEQSGNRWGQALQRTVSVFYAPVATFQGLARSSSWADWAVPILVAVIISVALGPLVFPYLDLETGIRAQLESQGRPAEQIDQAVEMQVWFTQKFWIPVVVGGYAITLAFLALVYWGGTTIFGGRIRYGTTLSVMAYAWMVKTLEGVLRLAVLWGREPVRVDRLDLVLMSSPASFMPIEQADTAIFTFARALNIFTLWCLALTAIGLSETGWLSRGAAYGLVGLLFGLYVAVTVGWAAIF
jgi:hypothetical protein